MTMVDRIEVRPLWHADLPVWITAMACLTFYAACFYPGAMSFDTAVIWAQVRGAPSDNIHGVGLLWLWRITEVFFSGPAPIYFVEIGLLWTGLALLASSLPFANAWRVFAMLAAGFAPVVFVLFAHVWNDVLLMAELMCACAALVHYRSSGKNVWAWIFLLLTAHAALVRQNAVPALIPLLVYFAYLWRLRRNSSVVPTLRTTLLPAGIILLVVTGFVLCADRLVARRFGVFAATEMWDLAAISVRVDAQLMPANLVKPELTIGDLRASYVPYSNVPVFTQTHGAINGPFFLTDSPNATLVRNAWLAAIKQYPGAYLFHRWRLTRALFGKKPRAWPHELIYVDGETPFLSNPPVTPNTNALHEFVMRGIEAIRATVLLAAWPYLLLAVVAAIVAWRRRAEPAAQTALSMFASALLYAAPLPWIAPSAELRYLGWPCLASLVGVGFTLAALRQTILR